MDGFQFNHDMIGDDEIGNVSLAQFLILIEDGQLLLWNEPNLVESQFELKALLIDFLKQPAANFAMDLETSSHEIIAKLGEWMIAR